MRIRVMLLAENDTAHEATVASTIDVAPEDLRWPERLAEVVAHRAHEGTRHLRTHLIPPPVRSEADFVPLADVVPTVEA